MLLRDLPPDLRATLSLLVDRGKSYTEIAELLGIAETAVRDRAHTALDMLANGSAPAAPWSADPDGGRSGYTGTSGDAGTRGASPASGPAGAGRSPLIAQAQSLPISRRGGAVLLAGLVAVVVVLVVLLTGGGGSPAHSGTNAAAKSSAAGRNASKSGAKAKGKAKITNQIRLTSPEASSETIGLIEVLAEGSQHAVYLAAEHLEPTHGFFYALWLYNSPSDAKAIGKTTVGSSGKVQAAALLPAGSDHYHQILLTKETNENPGAPGPTVLSGAFSLKG
jgi:Sigma-70, region 4